MKLGLNIVCTHPLEIPEQMMALAEEAGVDSVWTPDHLLGLFHPALWPEMSAAPPDSDPDAWYDPFVFLGTIGRGSSIPVGVCVTDTTRRRAPDLLRTALTLHHICPGGFNLGIGAGEAQNLTPFGYPFSTPVATAEEVLGELRALLDSGVMPAPHRGRRGLPGARTDIGLPRVWVAGHGPRMLRLTGEFGDGWMPAWPMSPEAYGERRSTIVLHSERAGRPAPECAMHVALVLGQSRDYILELFDNEPLAKLSALMSSADVWAEYGVRHPGGENNRGLLDTIWHDYEPDYLRQLAPTIPAQLLEEFFFIGSVEEVMTRLEGYSSHGLDHVVFLNTTGLVGGEEEAIANIPEFLKLRELVRDL
jgi:phthiodiolone/phenolphthiodiolone dimycocerosates ketoreductase